MWDRNDPISALFTVFGWTKNIFSVFPAVCFIYFQFIIIGQVFWKESQHFSLTTPAPKKNIKGEQIPNVAGSTAYTSNWVAELFGPSNLKKSTSGFPQRLYNSVLQGALGIDKDGIFGANTKKTVKEFQSAHGLTADGIAGAKTKAALAKRL